MPKVVPIHEPFIAYRAHPGAFSHGGMTPVRVVLHDTECHDAGGITEIEGVVNYWMQTAQPNRLGAHYIVDGDGNIGKLADGTELLYHVGGLNTGSIGIEQIGFASFTEKDWLRRPDQLDKVARLLAYLHEEYQIPLHVPARMGANQANAGVLTHAMVSRFEPDSMGHTDPGSGYPIADVLAIANGYVKAGGWPPPGAQNPPKKPGAGGGGRPGATGSPTAKKTITVRGGAKLEVIGHTAGVHRYVDNPAHANTIRQAMQGGHLHFDKETQ